MKTPTQVGVRVFVKPNDCRGQQEIMGNFLLRCTNSSGALLVF